MKIARNEVRVGVHRKSNGRGGAQLQCVAKGKGAKTSSGRGPARAVGRLGGEFRLREKNKSNVNFWGETKDQGGGGKEELHQRWLKGEIGQTQSMKKLL